MEEKKVLIVTYYWPPSGGSGVQRWLKFVKYLPQLGWTPYVFTPENPSFAIQDISLLKDVPPEAEIMRFPIWEPYAMFFKISKLLGSQKSAKPTDLVSGTKKTFFQKISTWLRGNLLIPDPRVFWVKPSVKFLNDFLIDNKIHTVITTGPPHSMHLIGYRLKKKNPSLKWIADFRDPWSAWGLLDSLMVSKLVRTFHKQLEYKVLTAADEVITITPFYVRHFEQLSGRKVKLITNGFDDDDFQSIQFQKTDKFIIRHVGIVNEKCDPRPFMEAVLTLMNHDAAFKSAVEVEFIGEVHPQFKNDVAANQALANITKFPGSVPHTQLIQLYGSASLLILILQGYKDAEGYMPGKLFEYLATGIPVLGVGPVHGDAAKLLNQTQNGNMFDAQDQKQIVEALKFYFSRWTSGYSYVLRNADKYSSPFSRRNLTQRLTEYLR